MQNRQESEPKGEQGMPTAYEIQKERIRALETKAEQLLASCRTAALTSVSPEGFPRTCVMGIAKSEGFRDLYFITSRRSGANGKAAHFEQNPKASVCFFRGSNSVTLVGTVSFVADRTEQERVWSEEHRAFFKRGLDDPKFRLLHFHASEATFWIEGHFRTCRYKDK